MQNDKLPTSRAERGGAGSRLKNMRIGRDEKDTRRRPDATQRPNRVQKQRSEPRQRTSLQAGLAIVSGRVAGELSRRLHLGGGTSIAGLVAQRVYPNIVSHLAKQIEHGSIVITGTNGKTTTSGFIAAILSDAGLRVWHNREGSNLMGGITSSLVKRALPNGHMSRAGRAISILEADEAVVPQLVQAIPPRVVVFTNLFRDQLDRYGEVDSVASQWHKAIRGLPGDTILVLNADDPSIAYLGAFFEGRILYFGIDDPSLEVSTQPDAAERHQVMDARSCPKCGGEYIYELHFYSHMGHYRCTNCDFARPQPDVRAVKVASDDFDRLRVQMNTSITTAHTADAPQQEIIIPLPGLYNVYNALAAATVAQALQIGWGPIVTGIEQFKPIFGRGERIQVEGRTLRLLLAKNPTGFNEVLRTLFSEGTRRHVLFVLNDNIADGRDISWIWDVDFERAAQQTATLVAAGSRALDLAVRLKYAGINQDEMSVVMPAPLRAAKREALGRNRNQRTTKNRYNKQSRQSGTETIEQAPVKDVPRRYGIAEALDVAIGLTPVGETLFVVPTYTGLLEIHHELEQRGLTPHYWEE